ncbi:hypothetical protein ACFTQ7_12540 [Lysinibacillus sp. NPDC056959]|uniref:hypothetical protein n=1 Tax=Lysinibacillus sp. NPDC056959 TaxID=3345981 RepID=UPI0036438DBD
MKRPFLKIGLLLVFGVVFLTGVQSFFNQQEINLASERCLKAGGEPIVERDLLSLNYTIACHIK